jgi:DNA-binding MarR family transcriptional regulator
VVRVVPEDVLLALEDELLVLARSTRVSTREMARAVHPRLDPTAYPLVALLARGPAMRPSEVAAALSLDKSTVSRQIDAVARLGLVERVDDPRDARARLVVLTEAGREVVTAQLEERRRRVRASLNRWDPADVEELTRLLHELGRTGIV